MILEAFRHTKSKGPTVSNPDLRLVDFDQHDIEVNSLDQHPAKRHQVEVVNQSGHNHTGDLRGNGGAA